MTTLVTGANGFVGRSVVAALRGRGEDVRALVRPAARMDDPLYDGVDVRRADLRRLEGLEDALVGVDVVIHLAATVTGPPEEAFASTVAGTERLVAAMAAAGRRRLVLAGSVAVYDWKAADGVVTEDTPLDPQPWRRGSYPHTKLWQEQVCERGAASAGFELVTLRPGFVWGPGNVDLAGVGQRLGPAHLVVLGGRRLPLTHVDNCADCFTHAAAHPGASGRVYNVVDDEGRHPWRYALALRRAQADGSVPIPVPYPVARGISSLAGLVSRSLFAHGGKLPSVLDPPRFEARFKPLRWSNERLRRELGWTPPVSFEQAWRATFAQPAERPAIASA